MPQKYDEEYSMLKARIEALHSEEDRKKRDRIIARINRERQELLEQKQERLIIDKKLLEQEKEYQEIVKAQEIMDQIDENRKRDA